MTRPVAAGGVLIPLVLALLAAPRLAFACSGPGAMETILRNERWGGLLWVATLVVAGASAVMPRIRSRGWRTQWPLIALVLMHPGWWMSARSGDCGRTLLAGSILVLVVTPFVGGIIYWRARRAIPTVSA